MPALVVGLDFGGNEAVVAKVENGGVVVLCNEMSHRSTATVLAFPSSSLGVRLAGSSALPHLTSHSDHAVSELRHLLGAEHMKTEHLERLKDKDKQQNGFFRICRHGKEEAMRPEQLVAAFLTHLDKNVVRSGQGESAGEETHYVLAVPHYFTVVEREALLDAAAIAGIKIVDVLNDLVAAALIYGYFQKDLPKDPKESLTNPKFPIRKDTRLSAPPIAQRPRLVAFVDFGYSAIQAALVEFTYSGLRVINVQSDRSVGGKDFDRRIAAKFVADVSSRRPEVITNKKAFIKLVGASEKAKRLMSASKDRIPVNVECLLEDFDFNGSISRDEFEILCREQFDKVEACLRRLLVDSKLQAGDLHSIEVIGGSSRVSRFKSLVQAVFGKPPSTTLNADEAVARGAAIHCAALTRVYSVRPFLVQDVCCPVTIQAKHALFTKVEESGEDKLNDDVNTSVTTNCVELTKIHKIFIGNENKTESIVSLKRRPDGDTIAVEYEKSSVLSKPLIAVYKLNLWEGFDLGTGQKISLVFRMRNGQPYLDGAKIVSGSSTEEKVEFKEKRLGGLTYDDRNRFATIEQKMGREDELEKKRQDLKNRFEDATFRFKDQLISVRDQYSNEEAWRASMGYVNGLQDIIFNSERYNSWPSNQLEKHLAELDRKIAAFQTWQNKSQSYRDSRNSKRVFQ